MNLTKKLLQFLVLSTLLMGTVLARPIIRLPGHRPAPGRLPAPGRPVPGPILGALQQITINMNTSYRGHNAIHLKQLIHNQHPRLELRGLRIRKVSLLAKSLLGNATATLAIGPQTSYPETVPGTPQLYVLPGLHTFSQVELEAPMRQLGGAMTAWQVLLNGTLKVRQIRVVLSR